MARPSLLSVAWRQPVVAALLTGVGVLTLATLGVTGPGQTTTALSAMPYLDMWVRWDAGWYQAIAEHGYTYSPTEQSAAAFFPVYPLLIRGVMAVSGWSVFVCGVVVTWVMGFLAALTFYAWARWLRGDQPAGRALWLLLLWPFASYLAGAMYSDATFLLWATLAFGLLERGRPGWATFFGVLATATRPIAPAVVLGLVARSIEIRRVSGQPLTARDFLPLASGLGLAAFMAFLGWRFGDPLGFLTTQQGWNQLSGLDSLLKVKALSKYHGVDLLLPLFHAALALLCLVLGWRIRRTVGWGYTVYVWAAVGIPLISSRDFIGLGRYALAAFPVFLELERVASTTRSRWWWVVALSGALLVWMTVRFTTGRYNA
ncbi:MAG: hypothetical protein JNG84_04170 [Archangium sp.]|nr:hypothetical protein [Archangium sp.]